MNNRSESQGCRIVAMQGGGCPLFLVPLTDHEQALRRQLMLLPHKQLLSDFTRVTVTRLGTDSGHRSLAELKG